MYHTNLLENRSLGGLTRLVIAPDRRKLAKQKQKHSNNQQQGALLLEVFEGA